LTRNEPFRQRGKGIHLGEYPKKVHRRIGQIVSGAIHSHGKEEEKMKRFPIILVGLIFVLSTTGLAFAQEKAKGGKAPEATKPAEPAKAAEAAKAEAPKPEAAKPQEAKKERPKVAKYRMGGLVIALDSAARKITIKQDKVRGERKVTLTVNKKAAKDLAGIKVGDEVNVWVTGKVITELQKVS
jgi:hypothetical protein